MSKRNPGPAAHSDVPASLSDIRRKFVTRRLRPVLTLQIDSVEQERT
jgi:hypothetical protein